MLVYKKNKQEKNFNDLEAEFAEIFCPDRGSTLYIPFKNIYFNGSNNKTNNFTYKMIYDQVIALISDNTNLLSTLKETFDILGFDTNTQFLKTTFYLTLTKILKKKNIMNPILNLISVTLNIEKVSFSLF